jgi:hypothetical protein
MTTHSESEWRDAATAALLDALSWMDSVIAREFKAETSYKRLAALIQAATDEEGD